MQHTLIFRRLFFLTTLLGAWFSPLSSPLANSLEEAVEGAKSLGGEETFIIGGAALFEKTLSIADRIYLTEVHAEVIGDVSFPADLSSDWIETSRERHEAGEQDDFDYSFLVLDRVATV